MLWRCHSWYSHYERCFVDVPGALQPEYMVKDADPDGFCTYPSVARWSMLMPLARPKSVNAAAKPKDMVCFMVR